MDEPLVFSITFFPFFLFDLFDLIVFAGSIVFAGIVIKEALLSLHVLYPLILEVLH